VTAAAINDARGECSMSLRTLMQGPMPVTAPLVLNPLMARMAEAAGFAAIEIEDQLVPKRAH